MFMNFLVFIKAASSMIGGNPESLENKIFIYSINDEIAQLGNISCQSHPIPGIFYLKNGKIECNPDLKLNIFVISNVKNVTNPLELNNAEKIYCGTHHFSITKSMFNYHGPENWISIRTSELNQHRLIDVSLSTKRNFFNQIVNIEGLLIKTSLLKIVNFAFSKKLLKDISSASTRNIF